ncbi:MAG: histidinol dehydrogenase [Deltaproteobacteria bacterium]|nr:histidinol dehydrogenase [Deltaproteobacteria bacterium]MBI4373588.1 histidinol dehydrogenase [Deltaproteobacteria bacterium]
MNPERVVRKIIADVSRKGDRALFAYTKKFDHFSATSKNIEVSRQERRDAWRKLDRQTIHALKRAADRIRGFHSRQKNVSWMTKKGGIELGLRWTPLERVGIYVPGGRAVYPSTVLMNAIPAKIAGVSEIIMTTPCPGGKSHPALLVAADLAGVDRIFKVGGAQAIAALAYGTKSVPRVDKIVGPGNQFVAEAKRQIFGKVAIDMIAGPTELVVVADDSANPSWIAADLISQAEHDPEARPILISPSSKLIKRVAKEVAKQISQIPRRRIAEAAFWNHGEKIKVKNLDEACERANGIAPEHLELSVRNPKRWLRKIRHAGAIFLGPCSPVALGDYAAGPNHVLPTGGTARFSSPLGVYDFMKGSSVIEATKKGLYRLAPVITQIARIEGLTAHAESVLARFQKMG